MATCRPTSVFLVEWPRETALIAAGCWLRSGPAFCALGNGDAPAFSRDAAMYRQPGLEVMKLMLELRSLKLTVYLIIFKYTVRIKGGNME